MPLHLVVGRKPGQRSLGSCGALISFSYERTADQGRHTTAVRTCVVTMRPFLFPSDASDIGNQRHSCSDEFERRQTVAARHSSLSDAQRCSDAVCA
eukprot:gene8931-biopygen7936